MKPKPSFEHMALADRFIEIERFAGELMASANPVAIHVAKAFLDWRQYGGRLDRHLALMAPRGSHRTFQAVGQKLDRDRLLVRFAAACGRDAVALAVLRGEQPVPSAAASLLDELKLYGRLPKSRHALTRARKSTRHPSGHGAM